MVPEGAFVVRRGAMNSHDRQQYFPSKSHHQLAASMYANIATNNQLHRGTPVSDRHHHQHHQNARSHHQQHWPIIELVPLRALRARRALLLFAAALALFAALGSATVHCQAMTTTTPSKVNSTAASVSRRETGDLLAANSSSIIHNDASETTEIPTTTTIGQPEIISPSSEPLAATSSSQTTMPAQQQMIANNKLKPINFTLVDELFASWLDDDELVRRWKHMDAQFQEGIRSILKLIFPQIVAISQDAKVSGDCSGGILKWILSLRNLRSWAIKMLDATGKPTSGIFQGSLAMMGNYHQCLSVRAPDEDEIEITDQFEEYFRGQYCVIHLRPHLPQKRPFYHLNTTIEPLMRKQYKYYEKTLYDELAEIAIAFQFIDIRLDLCVPSTCSRADIQRVAELLSKKLEFRAKVQRCDTEPRESASSMAMNDRPLCYWLLVPLASILFVSVATLLVGCRNLISSSNNFNENNNNNKLKALIYAFSIQNSLARMFTFPRPNQKTFAQKKAWPLYGLRNVFIVWFIIVQLTTQLKYQYLRESLVLRNMLLDYWPFQMIINTSMIFESIILITAFTYGHANLESTTKQLFSYIWRKYIRIVPSMIALISVTILTPHLPIASPVWRNFVDDQAEICKSTGYLNLFFLQNFIAYDKICVPHSWLLCVELQLIAITIPLVILLRRTFARRNQSILPGSGCESELKKTHRIRDIDGAWCSGKDLVFTDHLLKLLKSMPGYLSVLTILLGAILNFFIVYLNQLPPTWFNTFPDAGDKNYYFGTYLAKTWTHLSTFILGLLAGHLSRSYIHLRYNNSHELAQFTLGQDTDEQPGSEHRSEVRQSSSLSSSQQLSTTTTSTSENNEQLTPSASTSTIATTTNGSPISVRNLVISVPQTLGDVKRRGIRTKTSSESAKCCANFRSCLWQISAIICLACIIFSTYSWSTQQLPTPLVSALYDSLSRLIWSVALLGLMIQLCLPKTSSKNSQQANTNTNENNIQPTRLAKILSSKTCVLIGRLSLLAYLWAPHVHTFILAVQEHQLFPSLFLIFHVIVGNIVIIYATSFIMALFVEQPFRWAFSLSAREN